MTYIYLAFLLFILIAFMIVSVLEIQKSMKIRNGLLREIRDEIKKHNDSNS